MQALGAALELVLERGRDSYAASLRAAAEQQTWVRVAEPLARWISEPDAPVRLGDAPGVLRRPLAQKAREAAYMGGGRAILARRHARA